jgi:hypothetical protein
MRFANLTFWNDDEGRQLLGPLTPKQWAYETSSLANNAYTYSFRFAANFLELDPVPSGGQTISYEYYSKQYATSGAGAAQDNWQADTDLPRLPEDLFILGIRYHFKRAKGLPFAIDQASYLHAIGNALFDDTPKAKSNLTGLATISGGNLPDANFGI